MALPYLKQYSLFNSVEEMDENVQLHIKEHFNQLPLNYRKSLIAIAGYAQMAKGTCHLKIKTIADHVGCAIATANRAVKKLRELKIIEVIKSTKMNGIQGANIYSILPFGLEVIEREMIERENLETTTVSKVEDTKKENDAINSFNLLRSKQVNNINSLHNEIATQVEKEKEFMTDYQSQLFDLTKDLPLGETVRNELSKMILSIALTSKKEMLDAYKLIFDIALRLKEGTLTVAHTLRSLFKAGFNVRKESTSESKTVELKPSTESARPVKLYNWINGSGIEIKRPHTTVQNKYNWITQGGC